MGRAGEWKVFCANWREGHKASLVKGRWPGRAGGISTGRAIAARYIRRRPGIPPPRKLGTSL